MDTNVTFDISSLDIFTIPGVKSSELPHIHSILLYLYSKREQDKVTFKYSECTWLSSDTLSRTLKKLVALELITLIQKPTPQLPAVAKLKPNFELNFILNKKKKIELYKYLDKNRQLSKDNFKKFLGCTNLDQYFLSKTVTSWLRNVNSGVWDIYKFMVLAKVTTYFTEADQKLRTCMINKYTTKNFQTKVSFDIFYKQLTNDKKVALQVQLENALREEGIRTNGTITDILEKFIKMSQTKRLPEAKDNFELEAKTGLQTLLEGTLLKEGVSQDSEAGEAFKNFLDSPENKMGEIPAEPPPTNF